MKINDEQHNVGETNTLVSQFALAAENISRQLETVKREVFVEFQSALGANEPLLRLALIEADALVRQTDYPHLLFPVLAAEKAQKAARWQFHQQFLLRSNDALAA